MTKPAPGRDTTIAEILTRLEFVLLGLEAHAAVTPETTEVYPAWSGRVWAMARIISAMIADNPDPAQRAALGRLSVRLTPVIVKLGAVKQGVLPGELLAMGDGHPSADAVAYVITHCEPAEHRQAREQDRAMRAAADLQEVDRALEAMNAADRAAQAREDARLDLIARRERLMAATAT